MIAILQNDRNVGLALRFEVVEKVHFYLAAQFEQILICILVQKVESSWNQGHLLSILVQFGVDENSNSDIPT